LFNRRARRRLLLLFYKRRAQSIARSSDGFVADLWFQGFQSFGLKQKKEKNESRLLQVEMPIHFEIVLTFIFSFLDHQLN
jgi:hypothetical protein